MLQKTVLRVVTRAANGTLRIRELQTAKPLLQMHTQIGVDDCSSELALRGMPVFRELVGPIPDDDHVARYETPEVFEALTRKWSLLPDRSRRH